LALAAKVLELLKRANGATLKELHGDFRFGEFAYFNGQSQEYQGRHVRLAAREGQKARAYFGSHSTPCCRPSQFRP
jgi:hypothetical protein